jgi:hypothetical protein
VRFKPFVYIIDGFRYASLDANGAVSPRRPQRRNRTTGSGLLSLAAQELKHKQWARFLARNNDRQRTLGAAHRHV